MTIQECYAQLGGSFEDVSTLLPSQRLVEKFVAKFPNDDSYDTLCEAMARQDRTEAFRAAHTLKGVAANLGFSRLTNSASQLTEALRPESAVVCQLSPSLMDAVTQDYRATMDAIHAFLG